MPSSLIERLGSILHRAQDLGPDDGGSLIEAALVLPIVFLTTFGFILFSLVILGMGNANFASRAALRYATLHSGTSYSPTTQQDLNNIVKAFIISYPANTWSVSLQYYGGNVIGSGVFITVSISYKFTLFGDTRVISYSSTGCGSVQQ